MSTLHGNQRANKDVELITLGFPINKHISDAIESFGELQDKETFSKGLSNNRINLTDEPISTINIHLHLRYTPIHVFFC